MNNPICISTGAVYRLDGDTNNKIDTLKDFSIDGIELCFAYPQDALDFSINKENLQYLKSLKHNSIHAPWKNIIYKNDKLTKEVLDSIEKLYKLINATNVGFHIFKEKDLKHTKIFNNYNFNYSIENDDGRYVETPGLNTVSKIKKALKINPGFDFTFDFAHGLVSFPEEIPNYINIFKNKLTRIHISYINKTMKDHGFLYRHNSAKIRKYLTYLRGATTPFVLECVLRNKNEIQDIKKEIEYLKSI